MGAPSPGMQAGDQPAAETLLTSFRSIDASERRRHETVLDYWLSIRGDREFPPLHDLDPLEISEAGPSSLLLELIGGGEDAEVRHCGEQLKGQVDSDRVAEGSRPSILSSIAKKLSIVAISRNFLSYEDEFTVGDVSTRCWVTLLPLSASGVWVDYVYALVTFETGPAKSAQPAKKPAAKTDEEPQAAVEAEVADEVEAAVVEDTHEAEEAPVSVEEELVEAEMAEAEPEPEAEVVEEPVEEAAVEVEPAIVDEVVADEPEVAQEFAAEPEAAEEFSVESETLAELADEPEASLEEQYEEVEEAPSGRPGFSKILDSLANLGGFYGTQIPKVEPKLPPVEATEEPVEQPEPEVLDQMTLDQPVEEAVLEEQAHEVELEPAIEQVAAVDDEAPAAPQPVKSELATEGTLQSKLTDVRAKADEAEAAKRRATTALWEGLSAAYDFALDAEDSPEEYLKLVEAKGLKIQLRQPMKPVARLAFDGTCDDATLAQLEAVLAWAFKEDLARGALLGKIEEAGGIGEILNPQAKAA